MTKRTRRPPPKPGLPPGTLLIRDGAALPRISLMAYTTDALEELEVLDPAGARALVGEWPVVWVHVRGLGDQAVLEQLGQQFGIHRLAMEDVVNERQRPKVEVFEDTVYIALVLLSWLDESRALVGAQVNVFLGKGFVLTVQEHREDLDPFEPVRDRIRKGRPQLRGSGPDYLAYALVDAVVDHYLPLMETLGEHLEDLEERVVEKPDPSVLAQIRQTRRTLLKIRRAAWPTRDAIAALQTDRVPLFEPQMAPYLRDVHDHILRVIDLAESYRDQVTGLMDGYLSAVSFRMNEIMGVLTVVGTIFLPLGFLTGLYGMNFDTSSPYNMPELSHPFGYPLLLLAMSILTAVMLGYFQRRGWFALMARMREPSSDSDPS